MIVGMQLIGILFALVMLYLTFLYYKRGQYDMRGLVVWSLIWLGFLTLVLVPHTVYGIMEMLEIQRTVDFFVIGGFLVFSVILFHLYVITKDTQKKVEELVRTIAIKKAKRK
ncbi:MAG: DUF2304 family protein [Candidatus Nanoarchaeia archaeon]